MFTGKCFKLRQDTLGIESQSGERVALIVPAGETIEVLSGPRPDDQRMVDILWREHTLVMFTDDILRRGDELRTAGGVWTRPTSASVESVRALIAAIPQMKAGALFESFVRGDVSITVLRLG